MAPGMHRLDYKYSDRTLFRRTYREGWSCAGCMLSFTVLSSLEEEGDEFVTFLRNSHEGFRSDGQVLVDLGVITLAAKENKSPLDGHDLVGTVKVKVDFARWDLRRRRLAGVNQQWPDQQKR